MSWSRATEWLGLSAAVAIWIASFMAAGPALGGSHELGARAAATGGAIMDPMFVRDTRPEAGVHGLVLDAAGLPVPGALVFVYADSTAPSVESQGYLTDTCGRFDVQGLEPGHYSFVTLHSQEASGERDDVPVFKRSTQVEIVLNGEPIDA